MPYVTVASSYILSGSSSDFYHKIRRSFLTYWCISTLRHILAISAVNAIWYVLNRKTMEYKYCCIVCPARSISFKHILLREHHEPLKKQHDCVKYCWNYYKPSDVVGNNVSLCCLGLHYSGSYGQYLHILA